MRKWAEAEVESLPAAGKILSCKHTLGHQTTFVSMHVESSVIIILLEKEKQSWEGILR